MPVSRQRLRVAWTNSDLNNRPTPEEVWHGDVWFDYVITNLNMRVSVTTTRERHVTNVSGGPTGQTTKLPWFPGIRRKERPFSKLSYWSSPLHLGAFTLSRVDLYLPLDMKSIFPLWPQLASWSRGEKAFSVRFLRILTADCLYTHYQALHACWTTVACRTSSGPTLTLHEPHLLDTRPPSLWSA